MSSTGNENNTYDKYLVENDQFFYDEQSSGKGCFLKQDSELYNEEEASIPGSSVRVRKVNSDWIIYINGKEVLALKCSRFTTKEKNWLNTTVGFQFLLDGAKQGWRSGSEFKRQLKDIVK
jgi:hypothetical protein